MLIFHAAAVLSTAPPSGPVRSFRHSYYCLRHGQSQANVEGLISSDPTVACIAHGLSSLGWDQAAEAAESIASEAAALGVDGVAIVSSDLRRAWQTASAVRAGLLANGVQVFGILEERSLRERSFGTLSGQSDAHYEDVWVEDALSAAHERFECEAVLSVRERARHVVDRLDAVDGPLPPGRWMVVLVAHGDVLQILQTAFAQVDPTQHRSLVHLPTATLRKLEIAAPGAWPPHDESLVSDRFRHAADWPM